jgi:PAS domain S-box-containing protein
MSAKKGQATGTEEESTRLRAENEVLRAELAEAKETLEAIRGGAVDALVIDTPEGQRVFSLEGADHAYRSLIEQMAQGALTLYADGTIHYANHGVANLLQRPLEQIIGSAAAGHIAPADQAAFEALLRRGFGGPAQGEIVFLTARGKPVPTQIALSPLADGQPGAMVSIVVTDLTEAKQHELRVVKLNAELEERVARRTAELRESERLYRAIGESIDYGIWVCDAQGRNTYMSESLLKLVGITQAQCADFGWGEVLHPDDAAETMAAWKQCVQTGGPWYREHRYRGVDGQWHPILACGVAVRDDRGEVTAWAGINLDISRIKEAEQALRKSEERLRQIAHAACIGFFEWNASKGTAYWSPEHYELFGWDPGVPITWDRWLEAVHPEDRQRIAQNGSQLLERGRAEGALRGHKDEYRIIRADGAVIWLESDVSLDMVGGDPILRGSVRDITERKGAEEALRQSEGRYRSLFDGMTEGFAIHEIITDEGGRAADYRFLDVNAAFERLTGLKRENVVGRTLNEVLPGDDPKWLEMYGAVALSGKPVQFENYSPALARHYEVLAYQPAPRQFAVIFMDITARKRAEAALEASEVQYRRLFESAKDGILILNAQTGMIEDVNPYLIERLGLSREVFLGKRVWELGFFKHVVANEARFRELQEKEYLRYEDLPLETRDGRQFDVEFVSNVYQVDHRKVIQCNIRDISERKRAAEAVAAAHRQIQSLVDNTPAIVYAFDLEERFVLANSTLAALFNATPAQVIGKRRHAFMPSEDADWHEANDRKVIEAGGALEFEEYSQLPGRAITWLTTKFPLHDAQGRICAVAGISVDVSERKRMEDAIRQANATLEQRVSERTADLAAVNAKLQAQIDAYYRLEGELARLVEAERRHLGMELHDNLCQQIAATGMLTATLVNRLRQEHSPLTDTASHIVASLKQAGDDAHALARGLQPVQVEADGLMMALDGLVKRTREMQNVACAFECAASVPVENNTIATHLFRIAQEAINNAIKHGKARHIDVTLTNQDAVTLTIFDDGVGIPPEKRRAPGSGLRIMAYRARIIGGTLSVEPAPAGGTLVRCSLKAGAGQP